jgi:SAM-dependent methyltransferase
MSAETCPVCGGAFERETRGIRDRATGETFRIVRCGRCGFGLTDPVPASLDRYYPVRYRRWSPLAAAVLRRLYLARVDGWRARLPVAGRALELGAGTGWMLRAIRERGWRAFGTERTAEAARIAASASGASVFVGDLDAIRSDAALDLVIMFHVLEHLADPIGALRDVADRLRPGGTLVLGLPNIDSWQARLFGRHWLHLDVPRHLCHFTPASIERALRGAGLRLARIDFRSVEHDPLGWAQSALDRLGFEQQLLLRVITRAERRSGVLATAATVLLAIPLLAVGTVAAVASWVSGRGAVMEVWAVRDA